MKDKKASELIVKCPRCPGTIKLTRPPDSRYTEYRMKKPEDEDYIPLPYECENEDIIEVYWVRKSGPVFIAGPDPLERAYDHESSLY